MSASISGRLRPALVTAGYRAGWWAVRTMPEATARALFSQLAERVHRRHGRAVRQLEENLSRVVPAADPQRLRELSRESLHSYFRYWCETFRLSVTDPAQAAGRVQVIHPERVLEPIRAGRGVVVALPHMANWDLAGVWAVQAGIGVTTVAERVRPEALFERFRAHRAALGIDVLPLRGVDGGAPEVDPMAVMATRLRAGGFVCLLADRDLSAHGQPVRLLDGTARMPAGPAVLAARTGAVLLPLTLWYSGAGMVMHLHEPVEPPPGLRLRDAVVQMTQQVADVFTAGIREHPADWHMMQRVFLDSSGPPVPGTMPDAGRDVGGLGGVGGVGGVGDLGVPLAAVPVP